MNAKNEINNNRYICKASVLNIKLTGEKPLT